MATVELHKPGRGAVRVREAVVDRWINDGWSRRDVHQCPHCDTTAKSAGGLNSHIRARHDDSEEE